MKTEIFRRQDDTTEVCVSFTPADVQLMQHRVIDAAVGAAAECLANKFITEKGGELLAKIPLESVLNRVVAEVVLKIGSVKVEEIRR